MNFLGNKFTKVAYLPILVWVLSSCGSAGTGSSEGARASFDLAAAQAQISSVAPKCKLEKLDLPQSGTVHGFVSKKAYFSYLIDNGLTDFGGLLSNPENTLATYKDSGYENSPDENVFSWELNAIDSIYVCNSEGLPVSDLQKSIDEIGSHFGSKDSDSCRFYPPYSASDSKKAKLCLAKVSSIQRQGEWIVLATTNGVSPENLVSTFINGHNEIWDPSKHEQAPLREPVAFTENFTVTLGHLGSYWTNEQNNERNEFWKKIVKAFSVRTWDEIDLEGAGFSSDFSGVWIIENDLTKVIDRISKPTTVECSSNLKIDENSATTSDCGKVQVEVFQSDLKTGSCTFLGYWNDKYGSQRIGIFRYCDVFKAGSFLEDTNYTIRVRVSGPEVYSAASGSKNRVLGFTALGN